MVLQKKYTISIIALLLMSLIINVGCGSPSDSKSSDTFSTTVGDYTVGVPNVYNAEPKSSNDTSTLLADKETGATSFLALNLIDKSSSFTQNTKNVLLKTTIEEHLGLEDIQITGNDALSFSGTMSGVEMEGKIDMLYSSKTDKYLLIFIMHKYGSDYDYCKDLDGIVTSVTVNGETGPYNEPLPDSYNNDSTNDDKDYQSGSDWEKYDKDGDGKISDQEFQDATGDYIDDYYDDNGTDGDLNAYDYDGDGNLDEDEFQDATKDYMDENGY